MFVDEEYGDHFSRIRAERSDGALLAHSKFVAPLNCCNSPVRYLSNNKFALLQFSGAGEQDSIAKKQRPTRKTIP
jgi:hypothetical protein